jgi:hypothetical protein
VKEADWLTCTDSTRMLKVFRGTGLYPGLRRFAVECARRVRHLLVEEVFRAAARAGEDFADDPRNLRSTIKAMARAHIDGVRRRRQFAATAAPREVHAAEAALATCSSTDEGAAFTALREAARALNAGDTRRCDPGELRHHADLLRCIFGPRPFRPVNPAPAIARWGGGIVARLAQGIYEERAWGRLPILADAAEEAGCEDAELLSHLRGLGPHVRGCHAVALLLGGRDRAP